MIALTPFATAILSSILLKEHPSKKMWLTIISCFLVVLFIFYDSYQAGRIIGDIFGLLTAIFIGGSAVVVRYSKLINFLPSLLIAKFFTILIPLIFIKSLSGLLNNAIIWVRSKSQSGHNEFLGSISLSQLRQNIMFPMTPNV